MNLPAIRGTIDRRILVNYQVDPDVLTVHLPQPFRPKAIHGKGMVGICLIRLKHVRPPFLPSWLGTGSENAAHRAAVEWDDRGAVREGVYIQRRDSSSWFNALAGGRLFPGFHHHARFHVHETPDRFEISLQSDDGVTSMSVRACRVDQLPTSSVFHSIEEASTFFQGGSLGYSATPSSTRFQGLELNCFHWDMIPLQVEEVHSSVFEDRSLFPEDSIAFDSAFLMQGIEHEWQRRPDLQVETDTAATCCGLT